tara:strand:- start:765 stop:959 length:195 start_codon:yes stop_codon:yes gene_type:complete
MTYQIIYATDPYINPESNKVVINVLVREDDKDPEFSQFEISDKNAFHLATDLLDIFYRHKGEKL